MRETEQVRKGANAARPAAVKTEATDSVDALALFLTCLPQVKITWTRKF